MDRRRERGWRQGCHRTVPTGDGGPKGGGTRSGWSPGGRRREGWNRARGGCVGPKLVSGTRSRQEGTIPVPGNRGGVSTGVPGRTPVRISSANHRLLGHPTPPTTLGHPPVPHCLHRRNVSSTDDGSGLSSSSTADYGSSSTYYCTCPALTGDQPRRVERHPDPKGGAVGAEIFGRSRRNPRGPHPRSD